MFCTNKLEEYIDLRYEQNASQRELDILETLFDHFVAEEDPKITEDEINVEEAIGPGADLDEWLAQRYAQYLLPEKERVGYYSTKDLTTNLREAVWELSGRKPLKGVTGKQIWNAAKDAYERKKSLIERYKLRTKINHVPARLLPVLQKTGFDLSLKRP